ncbi:MAG: bis(5'-nucleosyl)-tetraphosphatase (symmetrical) YqeK [Eubacteriales bacterium]
MKTDIIEILKQYVDDIRLAHSTSTAQTAVMLAKHYGADEEKAYLAGLLHDIAKCLSKEQLLSLSKKYSYDLSEVEKKNTKLLHGPVGAIILENEIGIKDEEILSAVGCHTTGKPNMSLLDKIIYIADLIEPLRKFKGTEEIREIAYKDIDLAVHLASRRVLEYILKKDLAIHENTVLVYNEFISKEDI